VLLVAAARWMVTVESAVVCPPLTVYAPYCECQECDHNQFDYCEDESNLGTIYLDCYSSNLVLDDAKAAKILDAFINTPGVSPLGWVEMRASDLTRVPDQIRLLSRLFRIDLIRTEIQSIETGAFNAANSSNYRIYMDFSKITTIAPGAFSGYYGNGSIIILDNDNVTRFE